MLTLFFLGSLLLVFLVGAPIAFGLGFISVLGTIIFLEPAQLSQLVEIAYEQGTSTTQLVAPLFILMAEFISNGGIAGDIYSVLSKWLKKIPGSLGLSTILASTIFAALCGSSPATAVTIGKISIPEMTSRGYRPSFSVGATVAGGTLGIMIPPSLTFIVYGIITQTSIVQLFMAGILPGLLLSFLLCLFILFRVMANPSLVNHPVSELVSTSQTIDEKDSFLKDMLKILPALGLIAFILGSMYRGWATPTEAGGIGALGAFLIVLASGRLTWKGFIHILQESAKTSAMILFIIIGGLCFSFAVSSLGIPQQLSAVILGISLNKWVTLIFYYVLLLILGCLMDPVSMIVVTMPFVFPALTTLGFDPIFLGVVSTLLVEIGMVTPPVGMNLFVIKGITNMPFKEVVRGSMPFVGVLLVGLVIITIFPEIILYLPNLMRN
jgi:C4-dicarboxylate transporter, DctM subunit